jgi:hypothetical protein
MALLDDLPSGLVSSLVNTAVAVGPSVFNGVMSWLKRKNTDSSKPEQDSTI